MLRRAVDVALNVAFALVELVLFLIDDLAQWALDRKDRR